MISPKTFFACMMALFLFVGHSPVATAALEDNALRGSVAAKAASEGAGDRELANTDGSYCFWVCNNIPSAVSILGCESYCPCEIISF